MFSTCMSEEPTFATPMGEIGASSNFLRRECPKSVESTHTTPPSWERDALIMVDPYFLATCSTATPSEVVEHLAAVDLWNAFLGELNVVRFKARCSTARLLLP